MSQLKLVFILEEYPSSETGFTTTLAPVHTHQAVQELACNSTCKAPGMELKVGLNIQPKFPQC